MKPFVSVLVCLLMVAGAATAAQPIGKLFIKAADAAVDGQQFADADLLNTVKDMKVRHLNFALVDSEAEADYLIVVLERKQEVRHGAAGALTGLQSFKMITATLSAKSGDSWKPLCKLTEGDPSGWGVAAGVLMSKIQKYVKENVH